MTTITLKYAHHGQADSLGTVIHRAASLLSLWHSRASQRRQLAALGTEQLRDIGISREAALEEAARPFWSE